MRRFWTIFCIGVFVTLHSVSPVWAHAFLDKASPAAGDILTSAPDHLSISFTEPLEAPEITVTVRDATGKTIASNTDKGFAVDWTNVTLPLPHLDAGIYLVEWAVSLRPGHNTQGNFTFTVKP